MIENRCPVRNHGFAPNVSDYGCKAASSYLARFFVASGGFPCGCEPDTLCIHMPDAADRLYSFPDWWDRWQRSGTWLGNVSWPLGARPIDWTKHNRPSQVRQA